MLFKLRTKVSNSFHFTAAMLTVFLFTMKSAFANASYDFDNLVEKGDDLDDVNASIEGYSTTTFNAIKAVGVLVGIITVFAGVARLKKAQDANSGVSPMQGLALIALGGLFAVLPWLLITSASTVQT